MSNWDWDCLLQGSGLQPEDFMSAPSLAPPQDEYANASQVPLSAYGAPAALQDPNSSTPRDAGTPTAEDMQKALERTEYGQDVATPAARWIGRLGGGDQGAVEGLEGVTRRYLTGPLAAGAAMAGTMSDIHQGTSPLDAAVGNIVRGGLVFGAGMAGGAATDWGMGFGAIPASMAADHYLPPAPQIGHAIVRGILDPPPANPAIIYPPQYGGRPWW